MKYLIQIFLIVFLFSACKTKVAEEEIFDIPTDSTTLYFPKHESPRIEGMNTKVYDSSFMSWYSKKLFDLSEPVLYSYNGNYEIYRFTWLRSFSNPIVFRLQKQGNKIFLITKISNGVGSLNKGVIILNEKKEISEKKWLLFKDSFKKLEFWNLETVLYHDGGIDGSEWILEAVVTNKYHWVSRWSPNSGRHPEFRKVCEFLMSLSGISFKPEEFY